MAANTGESAADRPIRTPKRWIERRVDETQPALSEAAIARAQADLVALSHDKSLQLGARLDISFFPDGLESISKRVGLESASLLAALTADLEQGVTFQTTPWKANDGRDKACLLGTRWRAIVRPQTGKATRATLLVLESVARVDAPTLQPAFRPDGVRFAPIREEVPCDPIAINAAYDTCLRKSDEISAARARESELRKQRTAAIWQLRRELDGGTPDTVVQERGRLHASVRKQYSALRMMMDLLRLRSVHSQRSYPAIVEPDVPSFNEFVTESEGSGNLRARVVGRRVEEDIREDSLVEILSSTDHRSKRARVLSVAPCGHDTVVELDCPTDDYRHGAALTLKILSRFGMRAHQQAVRNLLDEHANGFWPDLAQTLCRPDLLSAPNTVPTPRHFFCDDDPGQPSLNDRQREAVVGALATPHTFCIQGPPGTGKTTVICELVQQLVAKGERVLLTAPTHVAVDEVLRRIGSRAGVRALRLSWNEGRIAEDVRKFAPSQIIKPFVERAQQCDDRRNLKWRHEQHEIESATQLLETLRRRRLDSATAQQSVDAARARLSETRSRLDAEEPLLLQRIGDWPTASAAATEAIASKKASLKDAENALNEALASSNLGQRMLGSVGLGQIGRARNARHAATAAVHNLESRLEQRRHEYLAAERRLSGLRAEATTASEQVARTMRAWDETAAAETAALVACRAHGLLKQGDLATIALGLMTQSLLDRHTRLEGYRHLYQRFSELVGDPTSSRGDVDGLGRDVLAVTNLFVCTTTGIAGSRELRDVDVDTLIVDEASRVTDSEFLIGALRAKRWILVGDEHQLPPYIEQNDEYFLHALSALYRAERQSTDLRVAVEQLGQLWEEDEELHQFRKDSVARIAERLQSSGEWASLYRQAFSGGIDQLSREVDDPSRALLLSMRDNLVRSLFERVVASCATGLRVRLVEQRRMIAPIADIVAKPVYRGDYCTPSEDTMAVRGITPLTTPTFPTPITFLDTSALGQRARDTQLGNGFVNRTEAQWVVEACRVLDRELAEAGSGRVTVSILSFYKAQARLIGDRIDHFQRGVSRFSRLQFSVIDAIDRIQGQEADIVILTFCRTAGRSVSPLFGQWLQDLRRLNVACTRARRALIFVGQKDLLARLCSNQSAREFYQHLNGLFESRPDAMRIVRQFGANRS